MQVITVRTLSTFLNNSPLPLSVSTMLSLDEAMNQVKCTGPLSCQHCLGERGPSLEMYETGYLTDLQYGD